MKARLIGGILATVLLATAAAPVGCGYYLHPERRGNSSNVAGGTLVMDLLWLLPGVIPGVIALVVDFTSGAVYRNGAGRSGVLLSPKGRVAVRLPESSQRMQVEVRLVSERKVIARTTAWVGPNIGPRSVELQVKEPLSSRRHETIYLEVVAANDTVRVPTSLAVVP